MLVNLFNSALATTPSDATSLTVLAKWILCCITFVFIALIFYVVILVNQRRRGSRSNDSKVSAADAKSQTKNQIDLDPLFLVVHLVSFGVFTIACALAYLI